VLPPWVTSSSSEEFEEFSASLLSLIALGFDSISLYAIVSRLFFS